MLVPMMKCIKFAQANKQPITRQESENLKEGQPKSDFWKGLQKFRLTIQNEGMDFTNEDFADLRDRIVGREIIISNFNLK